MITILITKLITAFISRIIVGLIVDTVKEFSQKEIKRLIENISSTSMSEIVATTNAFQIISRSASSNTSIYDNSKSKNYIKQLLRKCIIDGFVVYKVTLSYVGAILSWKCDGPIKSLGLVTPLWSPILLHVFIIPFINDSLVVSDFAAV